MTTDTSNKERLADVSNLDRLDRCDNCNAFYVSSANHSCSPQWTQLTKDPNHRTIEVLQEFDEGHPDDIVVYIQSAWSRAYHKTCDDSDADIPVDSRCRNVQRSDKTEWVVDTRDGAMKTWRFPCTRCHDLPMDEVHAELEARYGEVEL